MSHATTVSNQSHTRFPWATFLVVSIALFMVTLDNLVVSTALPSIRQDLGASLESLEWTVNAYTLAYAVFLLTGAAPTGDLWLGCGAEDRRLCQSGSHSRL